MYMGWFHWVMSIIVFYHYDTALILIIPPFQNFEKPAQNIDYPFKALAAL